MVLGVDETKIRTSSRDTERARAFFSSALLLLLTSDERNHRFRRTAFARLLLFILSSIRKSKQNDRTITTQTNNNKFASRSFFLFFFFCSLLSSGEFSHGITVNDKSFKIAIIHYHAPPTKRYNVFDFKNIASEHNRGLRRKRIAFTFSKTIIEIPFQVTV